MFAQQGQALPDFARFEDGIEPLIPDGAAPHQRSSTHPVFNRHHAETEMLRYLRRLADKDLALDRSMIPLGSCTMKLNATSEMIPVTWPEFAHIHPFAPAEQRAGYARCTQLEALAREVTGYAGVPCSRTPARRANTPACWRSAPITQSRGEAHRNVCLIPESAHGTNPASAQMAGMQVVVVACDADGNVDLADLRGQGEQHSATLAALMITYPSTHGVFEAAIKESARSCTRTAARSTWTAPT